MDEKLAYAGIKKLAYAGIYHFSYFFIQNIDYGYLLKSPRRSGSNMYTQSIFLANILKISFVPTKYSIFIVERSLCTLQGQVFVMETLEKI